MTYDPLIPPLGDVGAVMPITPRPPIVFIEGHGSWLRDRDGKDYLDFIQGWAVNTLGHCPPAVVAAVTEQAAKLINCAPSFFNEPMIRLATLIAGASGLDQVFFANSGAEANEGAIKLARKWGQKYRDGAYEIITLDHGFHGRTLATMSASGKSQWDGLFEPRVCGFPKAEINDIASVERVITGKTAAVMLEPIQGEAGVIVAESDFLKDLRALTRQRGILLILDEVQTGIGRTGKMFAFQHEDIRPDIMTLAKGLGGGVPIAALVAEQSVCCFDYGDQGGTFNGNPLVTAVGCAIMEEVARPGFLEGVAKSGAYLEKRLIALSEKHHGLGVRGKGLLLALDLGRDLGNEVVAEALRRGLLLNAPRPHLLRFMPALTVTGEEIDRMIGILDGILEAFPSY
ncbi:acetylornithine transaminase [Telmatospirillum siberiense]|uniref:Acetylornithine aminotransferase n=1 Tax=Telmatospirillum siberiense TaxID=382514 RepID=A0A2N3PNC6_9PROT|nr:acetylornithine transaminase [Telmatospirillum siberiense]PKU21903.1 acetylornithine transaminase [Telmatospirillum siberiense]